MPRMLCGEKDLVFKGGGVFVLQPVQQALVTPAQHRTLGCVWASWAGCGCLMVVVVVVDGVGRDRCAPCVCCRHMLE